MNLGELLAETRERLDDLSSQSYLWTDAALIRYLNEAEREAADRGRLILDETSSITRFDTVAGIHAYPLNPLILNVSRVKCGTRILQRTNRETLDDDAPRWETTDGQPRYFGEIENGRSLILFPRPVAVEQVTMAVYRMPAESMEGPDDEPEIHERHHMRLIDWALHLAFMKRDADTNDQGLAARYAAAFEQSFGVRRDANVQRKQRPRRVPCVTPSW